VVPKVLALGVRIVITIDQHQKKKLKKGHIFIDGLALVSFDLPNTVTTTNNYK